MFTYGEINFVVTASVLAAGAFGFLAGWLTHRAVVRERREEREPDDY